jgi:hypothetical protein
MRSSPLTVVAVAVVSGGVVLLVAGGSGLAPSTQALVLLAALTGWVSLLNATVIGRSLSSGVVLAVGALLVCVCVAFPPVGSKDVASYAIYGRMVAVHSLSPYTNTPADVVIDPWYPDVAVEWRHTASVYGPAFTAVSALGMKAAGGNKTAGRIFFQALAGLAVLISAALVADRTKDPGATAFVALNPVLLASVVNGGHNDALVGLGVLAGALLVERRRWRWAGVALALAAMVKIAAIVALPALAWWAWRRGGRRATYRVLAAGGGALLVGYAVAGGLVSIEPVRHAGSQQSRSSVWRPLVAPMVRWLGNANGHEVVGIAATALSLVAGALLVSSRVRLRPAAMAGAAAVSGYLLLGGYVLPWYWAWALLPLGLAWRTRLAVFGSAVASLLMFGYFWHGGVHGVGGVTLHAVSHWVAPGVALVSAAVLLAGAWADLRHLRHTGILS